MTQIAYTEKRPKCQICGYPSFGAYLLSYQNGKADSLEQKAVILCAECACSRVRHSSGFGSKKLKGVDLAVTFKLPPDKAPPPPREPAPLEADFVPSHYRMSFTFEGDTFLADLGDFPTEWAAMERARQISHLTAKSMSLRNFWAVEHGIHRVHPLTKEDPQ